jgi:SNF2 family DNA or RNA helicase
MAVRLDFDPEAARVVIEGDTDALTRNALFNAYLRSERGVVLDGGTLVIPTSQEDLHRRFQDLTKLLKRLGVPLTQERGAEGALRRVQDDERAFAEFSAAADAIWHSNVEPATFEAFVSAVDRTAPTRRFYRKQLLSAYHLAFAQNACNFSVPGAGKTSIVYAAFSYLNSLSADDPKHVDHLLVVGPLSSFKAWEDEFNEIFGRKPRSRRIAGFTPLEERRSYLRGIEFLGRDTELTLTTYATLASNADDFARFMETPGRRTMVVLDEAHNIKREDGYWASAALRLAPEAAARVVLTGTPAPNGYEDLANLFRFIYPRRSVIGFPTSTLRAMSDGGMPTAVERLKAQIRPFYTRIKKSDLGLPLAAEHREIVEFSPIHERIYTGIERAIMPQIRAAMQGGKSTLVRARLIRLRQAAVNPALLLRPLEDEGLFDVETSAAFSVGELEVAELVSQFRAERDLARLQQAVDLVRDVVARQGKVVIWSYFIGNLYLLREALRSCAQFVEVVTGATPVVSDADEINENELATREAIINRFHRVGETAVLIANPQAVGESISLHKAARTAIYFDRDFNAGRFIQSKDRIHRYNPTPLGEVDYYFLTAPGTVDTIIDQRLVQKEQRLADLVESEDIPLFNLVDAGNEDGADVLAILEDYERRKAV